MSEDYLEMLRKYGGKDNQDTASLSDENCPVGKAADAKIIESLPVSHRNAGTLLLSFFKDNGISYDEAHQIVINGDPIPSSHAQDLVHDLLRFRKSVTPPTGFEELAQALADLNISREYVKNLARYDYIVKLRDCKHSQQKHLETDVRMEGRGEDEVHVRSVHPVLKKKLKRAGDNRQKIEKKKKLWVSW